MTAALWWLAASVALIGVWCAGHARGHAMANTEWRTLFLELGIDHGREVQELTDQLARADATIDMLRRNDGMAFMAGQMLRADQDAEGLS